MQQQQQQPKRGFRRKPQAVVLGDFLGVCDPNTKKSTTKPVSSKSKSKSESNKPSASANRSLQDTKQATRRTTTNRKKRRSKIHSQLQRQRLRLCQQQQEEEAAAAAQKNQLSATAVRPNATLFVVRNLVQPDEMEEDDEFQDILQDVRDQMQAFGALQKIHVLRNPSDQQDREENAQLWAHDLDVQQLFEGFSLQDADVVVAFDQPVVAQQAFEALHGKKFGGEPVQCFWPPSTQPFADDSEVQDVVVHGMVAPEELEDSDEFEEVQEEVVNRFQSFGDLAKCCIDRASGLISLRFESIIAQQGAVEAIDGKAFGGNLVRMEIVEHGKPKKEEGPNESPLAATGSSVSKATGNASAAAPVATPEPKIPVEHQGPIAKLLVELLQRLSNLQERAHQKNPLHAKRTRRLVFGLREVRKFLVTHKVVCLITAVDIAKDQGSRELDHRLEETMQLAAKEDAVLVFSDWFSRRQLMKATKKNTRISCVAVISIDGGEGIFTQIKKLMAENGADCHNSLRLHQEDSVTNGGHQPGGVRKEAKEDTKPEASVDSIRTA